MKPTYAVQVFPIPNNAYREDESDDDSPWRWMAMVEVGRGPGDRFPRFQTRRGLTARRMYQWAWMTVGRLMKEVAAP